MKYLVDVYCTFLLDSVFIKNTRIRKLTGKFKPVPQKVGLLLFLLNEKQWPRDIKWNILVPSSFQTSPTPPPGIYKFNYSDWTRPSGDKSASQFPPKSKGSMRTQCYSRCWEHVTLFSNTKIQLKITFHS